MSNDNTTNPTLSQAIPGFIKKFKDLSTTNFIIVDDVMRLNLDEISKRLNISSKIQIAPEQKKFNKIDDVIQYMKNRSLDGNTIPITTMSVLVEELQGFKVLRDSDVKMLDDALRNKNHKEVAENNARTYREHLTNKVMRRLSESKDALTQDEIELLGNIGITMKKDYEGLLQQEQNKVEYQKNETIKACDELANYKQQYDPAMKKLKEVTQNALKENLVIKAENAQLQLAIANLSEGGALAQANQAVTNANEKLERLKEENERLKEENERLHKLIDTNRQKAAIATHVGNIKGQQGQSTAPKIRNVIQLKPIQNGVSDAEKRPTDAKLQVAYNPSSTLAEIVKNASNPSAVRQIQSPKSVNKEPNKKQIHVQTRKTAQITASNKPTLTQSKNTTGTGVQKGDRQTKLEPIKGSTDVSKAIGQKVASFFGRINKDKGGMENNKGKGGI